MAEQDLTNDQTVTNPPKPPRRKRGLILKIIGGLVVLIFLLILIAPTLISSGPVVSIALGQVNKRLNGTVEISSLSLGWFTGVKLEGARVFDASHSQIAELDHVVVPLPLWKAALGKLTLGDVVIDGLSFDAKYDDKGQLNFAGLVKSSEEPSKVPSTAPANSVASEKSKSESKLPDLSGNITLSHCHGTVTTPGKPVVYLTQLDGQIKIPNINQPITDQFNAAIKVGEEQEGTIAASGNAAIINGNEISLNTAQIHQTLDVKNLDLQAAGRETLQGLLGLHVDLDFGDKDALVIDANVVEKSKSATDPIHVAASCVGRFPNLQNLNLDVQSKFANGNFQGSTLSDLHGKLLADLDQLQSQASEFVDLGKKSFGGTLEVNLTDRGELTAAPYQTAIQLDVTAKNLKYSDADQQFNQPVVQLNVATDLQGSAQNVVDQIKTLSATLKMGDAVDLVAQVNGALLSLSATSPLDKLQAAQWQVNVPDVKPVMDLADAFTSATQTKSESKTPPLQFTSGAITLAGDVSHDGSMLKVNVSQVSATHVAFHRGDISYAFKPINLSLTAGIRGGAGPVEDVQVTQLKGDLGVATLSMPTPIAISHLSTTPAAHGAINLVGNLTDLTALLAAVQGQKPDAYPYRGNYTLTENIASDAGTLSLEGGLQIAKFQSFNGDAVTFSEDMVAVGNDIALITEGKDQSVKINSLTAAMQSSGAMKLALSNGTINHLNTTRDMQLHPTVNYDLAKLWPVIQPMMGDKYKALKIAGSYQKQFNVTGSYPAGQPSTVAIKTIHADGDLAVESFDYSGLSLQNFIVPFNLDSGQLVTVYANKTAAAAATANGGTLDLSNLTIDLTQDPPRLTTPGNKILINNLTINPLFSTSFLAKVINNPLFAGAKDASGLFALTIDDCTDLPMGNLVTLPSPDNSGKIDLHFSITKLNIGLANDALQSVLKENSFEANVNNATVAVAKGISTQHIKFVTGDYTLGFDGSVRLKDQAFIPMTLTFPLAAIATKTHLVRDPNVLAVLPDSLAIPVEGTVSAPKYRFEKIIPRAVTDATAKAVAGGLLGGNKNGSGGNSDSDVLGGLLNKLQKKKKN